MGWFKEVVVGLVVNFWKESLFNLKVVGDNGYVYGIG